MLMAAGPDGRVAAENAARGVVHLCPQCGAAVTLKRGPIVTAHFSHAPASECAWASPESEQHRGAKHALAAAFAARGLWIELEAEILSSEGDRRADVLVHAPGNGGRVAIEVQHSALGIDAIERRTRAYAAAGVGVIWVGTLDLGQLAPRALAGSRLLAVDRYAIPAWQRFAAQYHGVLWFWSDGAFWRGWIDDAWTAPGRSPRDRDDPWRTSRRWGALTLDGPFAPEALRIVRRANAVEPHERFSMPTGFAANFVLAHEGAQVSAPTTVGWHDHAGAVVPRLVALATLRASSPARPRKTAPSIQRRAA